MDSGEFWKREHEKIRLENHSEVFRFELEGVKTIGLPRWVILCNAVPRVLNNTFSFPRDLYQ